MDMYRVLEYRWMDVYVLVTLDQDQALSHQCQGSVHTLWWSQPGLTH